MTPIVNAGLATAAAALGLLPLALTGLFKRRLPGMAERGRGTAYHPPASVVVPCKGIDQGFRENILALLRQDYSELELLFVVDSDNDPAHDELRRLLETPKAPGLSARLLVAGTTGHRAQKITNMLAAIAVAAPRSEVLAFIDSDCRPDPGFVRRLVAPLADPAIGAATGYRWYHPPRPTLGSLLRSTWNAGAIAFQATDKTSHAWGGATAIRRETFERTRMADVWNNAVSDDMTLTVTLRRLGLGQRFVPACVAVSYESSSVAETLEFTNRQSLIARVYFPTVWRATAVVHALVNLLTAYGALSLALWSSGGGAPALVGAVCLLPLPLQLVNAYWLFGSLRDLLPERIRAEAERLRWGYVFTAPLASLMVLVNTVHAATHRRLTWRGVTYELRSGGETVVVSPAFGKTGP